MEVKIPLDMKKYIDQHGISYKYIYTGAEIDKSRFSRIINGQSEMRMSEYKKICNVLNVPAEYFFKDEISIFENEED